MSRLIKIVCLLVVALLYLLFPTSNSTNDAYAYAAYIKYGHTLAEPFHLLYNYCGFVMYKIVGLIFEPDVLTMMKSLNSIAAVVGLFLLSKILNRIGTNEKQNILLVMMCAFSFGVWRFATENETYILPIVFSLLASLYYLKYLEKPSIIRIVIIAFWASFACLFHVIHFFWWIGLFLGVVYKSRKLASVIFYFLPSLIVPVVYMIVVHSTRNCGFSVKCLWSFFTPVLTSDSVQYNIGADNFYLGVINFFRTFYQVHGYMIFLVKKNLLFLLPALLSVSFAVIAVFRLIRQKLLCTSKPIHYILLHILIFVLQLLWAVYSKGNAEFMVMLPFLLAIIAVHYIKPDPKFLGWMVASLFVWNMSYGILPNHFADFNKREKLLNQILSDQKGIYILEQSKEIQNQIFYRTGEEDIPRVMKFPKNKIVLDSVLTHAKKSNKHVYTDFYNRPTVINRAALTQTTDYSFMLEAVNMKFRCLRNFYGDYWLFEIK